MIISVLNWGKIYKNDAALTCWVLKKFGISPRIIDSEKEMDFEGELESTNLPSTVSSIKPQTGLSLDIIFFHM